MGQMRLPRHNGPTVLHKPWWSHEELKNTRSMGRDAIDFFFAFSFLPSFTVFFASLPFSLLTYCSTTLLMMPINAVGCSTTMTLLGSSRQANALAAVATIMAISIDFHLVSPVYGFSGCSSRLVATCSTTATNHPSRQQQQNYFHYFYHPLCAASNEKEMEEFEAALQEFELLMKPSKSDSSLTTTTTSENLLSPGVKPLTASSRRNMELELKLLRQLEESDDVVDPLVELWTAERLDAAKDLQEMELGNCSAGLVREEAQLRAMIQRYGSEWVEPMSRLAVLLFTKGRLMEAMDLVRNVVQVKPWHFEAGQLLVVMLLRNGDYAGAIRAARTYTLPELNENTHHRRRKRWVNEMTRQAQEILRNSLEATTTAVHPDITAECPVDEPYCWQ